MPRRARTPPVRLENQPRAGALAGARVRLPSGRALREDLRQVDEGFDSSGLSFVALRLLSRGSALRVSRDHLCRYDENVRTHLAKINAERREAPITLRYFQHVAALAGEHYLRLRSESRATLLDSLNRIVEEQRVRIISPGRRFSRFTDADLDRLALWMATGSGKTLLLHLNYRQFLHYNRRPLDNILLVTPNEGLSAQHIEDARRSGIFAARLRRTRGACLRSAAGHRDHEARREEARQRGDRRRRVLRREQPDLRGTRATRDLAAKRGGKVRDTLAETASPSSTAPPSDRRWPARKTTS